MRYLIFAMLCGSLLAVNSAQSNRLDEHQGILIAQEQGTGGDKQQVPPPKPPKPPIPPAKAITQFPFV